MLYREAGQFKTSYRADQAVFPIRQDLIGISACWRLLYLVVPLTFNDFWLNSVMIPTLIFALAAIGLNLLTGYAGQLSLGTGGFMGVGAYACYKLTTIFPDVNIIIHILLSGFFAAGVGFIFGLPSLADQRAFIWRLQPGVAVLSRMGVWPCRVALQLQCLRRHRSADRRMLFDIADHRRRAHR